MLDTRVLSSIVLQSLPLLASWRVCLGTLYPRTTIMNYRLLAFQLQVVGQDAYRLMRMDTGGS